MNEADRGISLFGNVAPQQIGVVNLVLSCLSDGPRETEVTLRDLLMRSGVSGGLVNPRDSLELAIRLGLVEETGEENRLTALGKELLDAGSWPPYNLFNDRQGQRMFDVMIHRPEFAVPLAKLTRKMRRRPDGALELVPGSVTLPLDELQCLHALQSVCTVRYYAGVLVMDISAYQSIVEVLGTSAALTEEELSAILELQRIRAVEAEYYVRELEVYRLTQGGRIDLAGLIERVATRDVSAGYDIRSFELDGSDKYIEVKSSTGTDIRFFLSRNEWRFLDEHDTNAWIYFVPRVHELPSPSRPVVAIPSPIKWIKENATVEAREFLVEFSRSFGNQASDDGNVVLIHSMKDDRSQTGMTSTKNSISRDLSDSRSP